MLTLSRPAVTQYDMHVYAYIDKCEVYNYTLYKIIHYIKLYMHIYLQIHIHHAHVRSVCIGYIIHSHICMHMHMHIRACICIHTCMYVHMYVYIITHIYNL